MTAEPQTTLPLDDDQHLVTAHRKRGLFFIGLTVGGATFALTLQMATNANFVADVIGISGYQQGLLEALRETCGITALVILAMLAGLAEPLVGAIVLAVFGVGLASYFVVPDFFWLVVASMVWSQGVHVWFPLPNSMTLALAEPGRAGHRLGQIQAAGAVGSAVGLGAALLLHTVFGVQIRMIYIMAGGAAVLAAAACLGVPRKIKTTRPRFIFRRKYWLYYLLSFLEGWRKQIFVAFAGYLLVKQYGTPLWAMLTMWMAIQAAGYVTSPLVGRIIDRVGERRVLTFYFACLTVFFVGYAYIQNRYALYAIYVLDSAFFVMAMALTTYVNRIAPKSEHTATLSMGVAMNHVAAVIMPLAGGLIWRYYGHQWAFLMGAAAAAGSIIAVMALPKHEAVPHVHPWPPCG